MPPIGIGIGIMRPMGIAAPCSIAAAAFIPPSPDIAALPNRVGIDPCQVDGTDNAPTMRALPKPADIAAPSPPPPSGFIAGSAA